MIHSLTIMVSSAIVNPVYPQVESTLIGGMYD